MTRPKPFALAGAPIAGRNLSACTTGFTTSFSSYAPVLPTYFSKADDFQPGDPRAIPYIPCSADEATAARVRNALFANLGAAGSSLPVQVSSGVVELGGRPGGMGARDAAVLIAKRTYRVTGVSDSPSRKNGSFFRGVIRSSPRSFPGSFASTSASYLV